MKKTTKLLSLLLVICMLASVACTLAGCPSDTPGPGPGPGPDNPSDPNTPGSNIPVMKDYAVEIASVGGMAIKGCSIMAYTNEQAVGNYVGHAVTDDNGRATLNLEAGKKYWIKLDAPDGYMDGGIRELKEAGTRIPLNSAIVPDTTHTNVQFNLGDIAREIEVTTIDGKTWKLSEILAQKKMVMLNFFYYDCGNCWDETPYMQKVYEEYEDEIAIIMLNTNASENLQDSINFRDHMLSQKEVTVTMPIAQADPWIFEAYLATFSGMAGYPTSIIIDRYGMIAMREVGAITSEAPFRYIFDYFTSDAYVQKVINNSNDVIPVVKPEGTTPPSEDIKNTVSPSVDATFEGEDDGEIYWPFAIGKEPLEGVENYIYPTNIGVQRSYSLLRMEISLKKGQVLALDYLASSEINADIMHVIVNDVPVFSISGESDGWDSCYPIVADEDATYTVIFSYIKDGTDDLNYKGRDCVYLSNIRIVTEADIDVDTYLPREASNDLKEGGDGYESYITPVYNPETGYYHVGTEDGPILLAKLLQTNHFVMEGSVYSLVYEAFENGEEWADRLVEYCNYSYNGYMQGYVGVTQELKELLQKVTDLFGIGNEAAREQEWLEICCYYDSYPESAPAMQDPTAGLASHNAFILEEGERVTVNYDRILVPRGLIYKFTPAVSGAYRVRGYSEFETRGWIHDAEGNSLHVYERWDRFYNASVENCDMYFYMEAGTSYYISVVFWETSRMGTLEMDVQFVAESMELFRAASTGPWTYYMDEFGNVNDDHLIAGGVKTTVDSDGYCRVVLEDGSLGSYLYLDATHYTEVFNQTMEEIYAMGGFDFSLSAEDEEMLIYIKYCEENDLDIYEYLHSIWGEDDPETEELEGYPYFEQVYRPDDVINGKLHPIGDGEDKTAVMEKYIDLIITAATADKSDKEVGCIKVTEELRDILKQLLDKYVFEDIEEGYTKMCYYYEYLGPTANA